MSPCELYPQFSAPWSGKGNSMQHQFPFSQYIWECHQPEEEEIQQKSLMQLTLQLAIPGIGPEGSGQRKGWESILTRILTLGETECMPYMCIINGGQGYWGANVGIMVQSKYSCSDILEGKRQWKEEVELLIHRCSNIDHRAFVVGMRTKRSWCLTMLNLR